MAAQRMSEGVFPRLTNHGITWCIRYRVNGVLVREKVGRESDGITKQHAINARKSRMGDIVQGRFRLPEIRKPIPFRDLVARYHEFAATSRRSYSKEPEGYFWRGEKLEKYAEQFLSDDQQGFIYTYGNRLRKHFQGIDQIQEAINRLKNCKESRRAISITWDPPTDTQSDEVPCMIIVDFKIRDGKLQTTGLWRSHDIYGAWFPNAVGLTNLASYVAKEVGVDVGTLTIHSISAHIYEVNFEEALRF